MFCITNGDVFAANNIAVRAITTDSKKARTFETEESAKNFLKNTIGNKNIAKMFRGKKPQVRKADEGAAISTGTIPAAKEIIVPSPIPDPIKPTLEPDVGLTPSELLDYAGSLVDVLRPFEARIAELDSKLSAYNGKVNDYNHLFELHDFPANIRAKLIKEQTECLRERRKVKDALQLLYPFREKLEGVSGIKATQFQRNYYPRVLDEKFREYERYRISP